MARHLKVNRENAFCNLGELTLKNKQTNLNYIKISTIIIS